MITSHFLSNIQYIYIYTHTHTHTQTYTLQQITHWVYVQILLNFTFLMDLLNNCYKKKQKQKNAKKQKNITT